MGEFYSYRVIDGQFLLLQDFLILESSKIIFTIKCVITIIAVPNIAGFLFLECWKISLLLNVLLQLLQEKVF